MGIFSKIFSKKKKEEADGETLVLKGKLPKFDIPQVAKPTPSQESPPQEVGDLDIDLSMIEEETSKEPPKESKTSTAAPLPSAEDAEVKTEKERGVPTPETAAPRIRSSTKTIRKRKSPKEKQIGNLLVAAGVIDEDQLSAALKRQEKQGGLLGKILVDMNACKADDLPEILSQQRTITTVDLKKVQFDPIALKELSRTECKRFRCIPFQRMGRLLCVAMSNVLDGAAKNEIREITQTRIKPFDARWEDIAEAIDKYYPDIPEEHEKEGEREEKAAGAAAELVPLPKHGISEEEAPEPERAAPGGGFAEMDIELPEEENELAAALSPKKKLSTKPETAAPTAGRPSVVPATSDSAIPVDSEYLAKVLPRGKVSSQERWMAERSAETPLPAEPVAEEGNA
ncbi:MAG: hypothetical protein V1918_10165 [Planctomycetota bacterium]